MCAHLDEGENRDGRTARGKGSEAKSGLLVGTRAHRPVAATVAARDATGDVCNGLVEPIKWAALLRRTVLDDRLALLPLTLKEIAWDGEESVTAKMRSRSRARARARAN